jgi:hypothetical protein
MAKKVRKAANGKDESSVVLVIDDFLSYENLVRKRLA